MKNIIFSIIAIVCFYPNSNGQELAPYIKIGESNESIQQVSEKVIAALNLRCTLPSDCEVYDNSRNQDL